MKKYILIAIVVFLGTAAIAQEKAAVEPVKAPECENKWGIDSVETAKQLSLFNQYYQEKKYAEAYPYWLYLFENAPCIQKRITYNGPTVIKEKLKAIKKAEGKDAYFARVKTISDTLFMTYQKRIELFGQEGYVKGKWANDIVKMTPQNREKGLVMFHESISLEGAKTRYKVPKDYIYAGVKHYQKKKLTLDSLFMILEEVSPIIDVNIAKYTATGLSAKDSIKGVKWQKTQDVIIGLMKPYLDCDKLTELKQPHFADNKTNPTWLRSTVKLLDRGRCEKKPFYLECSEALFELEPNSDAALSLAKAFGKQGDDVKATIYYNKAADLATSDDDKYKIYIKLAKTAKNNKKYSRVRDYARKAIAINANSGEAYILIGDAYRASARSCGGDLGAAGVYLVAVDKYIKARNVDPTVAEKANSKIGQVSGSFPNKEDSFFKGINVGDSYRVGCWIGESTTVRFGS